MLEELQKEYDALEEAKETKDKELSQLRDSFIPELQQAIDLAHKTSKEELQKKEEVWSKQKKELQSQVNHEKNENAKNFKKARDLLQKRKRKRPVYVSRWRTNRGCLSARTTPL